MRAKKRTGGTACLILLSGLVVAVVWGAAPAESVRVVILGDRTGETQAGVYEKVWARAAAEKPDAAVSVGDTIQGLKDTTADAEWQEAEHLIAPYKKILLYLAPGNHDIWSEASEQLFVKYSGHATHYSFDCGPAHFTVLDNSRSEQLSPGELSFLEEDLKAHAGQTFKVIVSHRPSWIFNALLGDNTFPLHVIAKKYGVKYVIAGHVHEMLHFTVDGIEYVSMVSSGGHLRASGKYEDGWFFGYGTMDIQKNEATFRIHDLEGRETVLKDWGPTGLKR